MYWARCAFEGDYPWEIREIEGKGFAAFATRRFAPGDVILRELPTVWIHGHHPFREESLLEMDRRVEELGEEDKAAFFAMTNVFPEAPSVAAGIFMTNSFDMTDAPHGESCAMYCAIARLNHSCSPNVQQTHIPSTLEEVVIACRTIEIGDEINDSYIDLRMNTSRRKTLLRELYRFDCDCTACQDRSTDKPREDAARLESSILSAAESDVFTAFQIAEQYLKVLLRPHPATAMPVSAGRSAPIKEVVDKLPWSSRYVAEAYLFLYQLSVALEETSQARVFLQRALQWNSLLQGDLAVETIRTRNLLREFV